jgi:SAM-dependent methyltransferase
VPAPAVPADWLSACYGPNWATPDPSFRFETPLSTRRRFRNWFGSQNGNRMYWEELWGETAATPAPAASDRAFARGVIALLPDGAPVLEIGCGAGGLATAVARSGHETLALDYSFRALALAREHSSAPHWRHGNAYDRRRLLELGAELVRDGRSWHVVLDHLLDIITAEGRANVFLLLRQMLEPGAFAIATIDTNFVTARHSHTDPLSWHYPVSELIGESGAAGLSARVIGRGIRRTVIGMRTTATVLITRTQKGE